METGITGKFEITVDKTNVASAVGSGLLDVFATPCMLAGMEKTAADSVGAYLEAGQTTVGVSANLKHTAATPVGMTVRFESKLTEIDRRRLVFEVRAFDDCGEIGSCVHERFIVDAEKFMAKAAAKKQ